MAVSGAEQEAEPGCRGEEAKTNVVVVETNTKTESLKESHCDISQSFVSTSDYTLIWLSTHFQDVHKKKRGCTS